MNKLDKTTLVSKLSPPLDHVLIDQLLSEYISLEKRYLLRDWEPATLDGGQCAEAAARIIYQIDSNNLNRRKGVNSCLVYIEDKENCRNHSFPDRRAVLHLCRTIRLIYKFRSSRGAIHIDPDYTANHLDSKLVKEGTRWILCEILRIFWTGNKSLVSKAIEEILTFEIPAVGSYEGQLIVQRTDLNSEEEILILLYSTGEIGLPRKEISGFVLKSQSSVDKALRNLSSGHRREIIKIKNEYFRLTDKGIKKVITELAEKMLIE